VSLDFRPLVVHEIQSLLTAPFNPLRGPFGPSRLSRQREAQTVSLLSDECPTIRSDAGTTPSADFCRTITSLAARSVSNSGHAADLPR